jgi:hypothetical protein
MVRLSGIQPVVLPTRGQVFKVLGAIQDPVDKKYDRRAVVVRVPRDVNGRITIITRTTNTKRRGVYSPIDLSNDLDEEGVWGYYRTVDARLWVKPDVKYIFTLPPNVVDEICAKFRIRGEAT